MTCCTKAFVIAVFYFASSYGVVCADKQPSEEYIAIPFDHDELQAILKSINSGEFDDDKVVDVLPRLVISCKPESTRSIGIAALLRLHQRDPQIVRPYLSRFAPLLDRAKRIQEVDDICTMFLKMGEIPEGVVAVIEEKFAERDEDNFFANGKMAALLLKASPENAEIGEWFEEQMRHEDKYHRLGALSAMSYAGDAGKPSLPIINRRLHDESPAVRVAAASAVWRIEGDAVTAVPILLATLDVEGETYRNRPSGFSEWLPDHRIVAVGALGEITKHKKEIAQALLPLLNDDDELVQFMTLRSLARLNERGPGIIEAVRKKTNSQESLVANEANETLKRITADEPR